MNSLKYYVIIVNYFIWELLVQSSKPQLYFRIYALNAITIIFQSNYCFVIRTNETQISVFNSSQIQLKIILVLE